jgi:hypothetical protein
MKCSDCGWTYPDGYVNPFVSSKGNEMLCGICALAASNELHGTHWKQFGGETAEDARQDAVAYRELNPKRRPA